jgi:acyl carrier protein
MGTLRLLDAERTAPVRRDVGGDLRRALATYLGLAPERLTDALPLGELLLAAEDFDEIIVIVESELGVIIPDFAIERIGCLGDLIRVVQICLWAGSGNRSHGRPPVRTAA